MKARQVHVNYDPIKAEVNIEPLQVETPTEPTEPPTEPTEPPVEPVDDNNPPTETVEPPTEPTEPPVEPVEAPSFSDEDIFKHLSEKMGKEIKSFDDLSSEPEKAPELPSEVQKYLEYKKETGRGFEDFIKANRDISSLSDDDLMIEYVIRENEGFDVNDAIEHLDDMFGYEEDDPEKEKGKKNRLEKSFLAKAKKAIREESEKYKVPVESTVNTEIPDEYKQAFDFKKEYDQNKSVSDENNAKIRQKFEQETDSLFSKDFKGFEIKVGDDVTELYKPSNVEDVKSANLDLGKSLGKFFNEDGTIKDANGYHKALTAAFDPDAFAAYFFEKGRNSAIEGNVDDNPAPVQRTQTGKESTKNDGFAKTVKVDSSTGSPFDNSSYGTKFKMKHYR